MTTSGMKTLKLDLGERAYPIHIGTDLLTQETLFAPHVRGTHAVIVTSVKPTPETSRRRSRSHPLAEASLGRRGRVTGSCRVGGRAIRRLPRL